MIMIMKERVSLNGRTHNLSHLEHCFVQDGPRMTGHIGKIVGEDDAADVVADAFVSAMQSLPSYKETGHMRGWVYQIAHNRAKNHLRHKGRRIRVPLDEAAVIIDYTQNRTPEDTVEEFEARVVLREGLKTLSAQEHLVIRRRYVEGKTVAEVAQEIARTHLATKLFLHRAIVKLRRHFTKRGWDL